MRQCSDCTAAGGHASYSIVGLAIPAHLVPFGSLALTQVLIPRASFVGHLAGILVGILVGRAAPTAQHVLRHTAAVVTACCIASTGGLCRRFWCLCLDDALVDAQPHRVGSDRCGTALRRQMLNTLLHCFTHLRTWISTADAVVMYSGVLWSLARQEGVHIPFLTTLYSTEPDIETASAPALIRSVHSAL